MDKEKNDWFAKECSRTVRRRNEAKRSAAVEIKASRVFCCTKALRLLTSERPYDKEKVIL